MRLIIVSNRLPVTVTEDDTGYHLQPSVGGLVSSLRSYLEHLPDAGHGITEYLWLGWPGCAIAPEQQAGLRAQLYQEVRAWPVFVEPAVMDSFYHGFCNKTLWPLFHYFPSYTAYDDAAWDVYQQVNAHFCAAISAIVTPDDVIWIHDYHLLLLPQMVRAAHATATIGFFLHIPFPTYEVYRMLPSAWRTAMLDGLLGADLIGLHTPDDVAYLRTCLERLRGLPHTNVAIPYADRTVAVVAAPISIDPAHFAAAPRLPAVQQEIAVLEQRLAGHKVIMSVDRLDYSKGLLRRLQGYQHFLAAHPEWHGRVVLALVVVPSRIGVDQYQTLKQQLDEAVGNINGQFGTMHWTPVIYQYRTIPFEELVALYRIGDVALITPLRDGMNLVCKEYVATRGDQTGVLILSEMAGAAHELTEALIINPNNRQDIAAAIVQALTMPVAEQCQRMAHMQRHLAAHTVMDWATQLVGNLQHLGVKRRHEVPASTMRAHAAAVEDDAGAPHATILIIHD